jgi:hypothetical protein
MYMLSLLIVVLKTAQIRVRNIFEILRYMGETTRHPSEQRPVSENASYTTSPEGRKIHADE